jgi:hypothetical protein
MLICSCSDELLHPSPADDVLDGLVLLLPPSPAEGLDGPYNVLVHPSPAVDGLDVLALLLPPSPAEGLDGPYNVLVHPSPADGWDPAINSVVKRFRLWSYL